MEKMAVSLVKLNILKSVYFMGEMIEIGLEGGIGYMWVQVMFVKKKMEKHFYRHLPKLNLEMTQSMEKEMATHSSILAWNT